MQNKPSIGTNMTNFTQARAYQLPMAMRINAARAQAEQVDLISVGNRGVAITRSAAGWFKDRV